METGFGQKRQARQTRPRRVAVVGLPNTGKSQVFGNLTGHYSVVANYPLTTVELKRARVSIRGEQLEFVDTPGLHCLYIHSEEELEVRDFLFDEPPDAVIQCIDSNRIRQSLPLAFDLIELGLPLVVSLNAIDETQRAGLEVNAGELSSFLGVPVVESVATEGRGTEELRRLLGQLTPSSWRPVNGAVLEEAIDRLERTLPLETPFRRKTAQLLLLGDGHMMGRIRERFGQETLDAVHRELRAVTADFGSSPARALLARRDRIADLAYARACAARPAREGGAGETFARLARHPVWGIPILAAILASIYVLVVHGAGAIAEALGRTLVGPAVEGIRSVVPVPWLQDFLVGDFGLLTLGVFNAFLTVLPILSVFFVAMGVLEDVGYLPNLSVLSRRVLGRIGLSGRSVLSLVLGFGCKTMATLTTRGITNRKERLITIYLIAFAIPCSAQFALDMSILGQMGIGAFALAYGFLAAVELLAGAVLNKILPGSGYSEFIQELPPIRVPRPGAVLKKTGHRLLWFLKEALPVFCIAAVALFAAERTGLLAVMQRLLSPLVVGWLGLPVRLVEVLILSFTRHEVAAGMLLNMVGGGELDFLQTIVAVVITTMFVPCIANIVAMCKELGVGRGVLIALTINISSFVLAGALRWGLLAVGLGG